MRYNFPFGKRRDCVFELRAFAGVSSLLSFRKRGQRPQLVVKSPSHTEEVSWMRIRYESTIPGRSKPELSQFEPAHTCSRMGGQGDNNADDTDSNERCYCCWELEGDSEDGEGNGEDSS